MNVADATRMLAFAVDYRLPCLTIDLTLKIILLQFTKAIYEYAKLLVIC